MAYLAEIYCDCYGSHGNSEDLCVYDNGLGDSRVTTNLTYSELTYGVFSDSCMEFVDLVRFSPEPDPNLSPHPSSLNS